MASSQELPPFLRIAGQIRDQIYGYLLSTKYTKHYPREEDPEWEYNPHFTSEYNRTPRPTHVYHFHVHILGANRQINREASNMLYDQNMFVQLTSDLTVWDIDFKWLGVPIVAQGTLASRFVYSVLHIKIKPERVFRYPGGTPLELIFAGADLPAFCTALLLGGESPSTIFGSSLSLNLNCNTADEQDPNYASFSIPQLESLLEPLRLLHSFQFAHITGPLDEEYKTDLCMSICKKAPSFQNNLSEVRDKVQEGDEAFNARSTLGHYRQAIKVYNTAMTDLKDRCSRFYWVAQSHFGGGPVAPSAVDVKLHNAYKNIVFKLRINLAIAHIQLEQYKQCRKWSGRAVRTIDEYWVQTLIYHRADPRYVKAFLLNARSNNKLGRWEEAVKSMQKAVDIAPHLARELELFKEDEKKHKEKQLKTVRAILKKSRNQYGRPLVIRYPADFETVKKRLLGCS